MALITGVGATINGWNCLREFRIRTKGMDNAVACSSSAGQVMRADTNYDWMAECEGYGSTPPTGVMPGVLFTFVGGGVSGGAIVDEIEVDCNPQTADVIKWRMKCSAAVQQAALTDVAWPAAVTVFNASPVSSKGRGVGGSGGAWNMKLIAHNTPPIWLSSGNGYPQRAIGYMDAIVRWDLYSDTRPAVGADTVTLPVTDSASWVVRGYILESETEVVVADAQNRPVWVREAGVLVYNGEATGGVTTPLGATWPTV